MSRIPGGSFERIPGVNSARARATPWVPLDALIAASVAVSDPGTIMGTVTKPASTGYFQGATRRCNTFGWNTTSQIRDGYDGEVTTCRIGLLSAIFGAYDNTRHAVQIRADFIDAGTLGGTSPIIAVALAPNNTTPSDNGAMFAAGFSWTSDTSVAGLSRFATTNRTPLSTINPTTGIARCWTRIRPRASVGTARDAFSVGHGTVPPTIYESVANGGTANSANDALFLILGQATATANTISNIKIGFDARLIDVRAAIDDSSEDWGCQG